MKIRVKAMVKDPVVSRLENVPETEDVTIEEPVFLDGPISQRVAVVDFDGKTGQLVPGAKFRPKKQTYETGRSLHSNAFVQVSTFAIVHKTLQMYEEPDSLGRKVRWAFDGPQLLVVPRAGDLANAFYQRESRSLQFFSFKVPGERKPILTAHSQDIVAHETAHAILDGIAPDLYNAITPESLAMHESIADLTAALTAFRSRPLAKAVLDRTQGSIRRSGEFSGLAEQFASARNRARPYLRDLLNELRMDQVDPTEPHELSQVLSGALYRVMLELHEDLKRKFASGQDEDGENRAGAPDQEALRKASGKALAVAASRFKRALLRGIDYLPPGECTFADLGRAILAADAAAHPDSPGQRRWLKEEFVTRGIVNHETELDLPPNSTDPLRVDPVALVESDWTAYQFATRNRELLGIPERVPFRIRPRLDVTKLNYHRSGPERVHECIFKVSWNIEEENRIGSQFPGQRQIVAGTTLALDWETRRIRAKLSTAGAHPERRDAFLKKMIDAEAIHFASSTERAPTGLRFEALGDVMRVFGGSSLLHLREA